MMMRNPVWTAIGLVTVAVLVSLLLAELVLRLAWSPHSIQSTAATERHPVYRLAPLPGISGVRVTREYRHAFQHTAQGLRGRTVFTPALQPGHTRRILFLGDSFTYGLGSNDEDTFVALIDLALPDVEVVNSGFNGYGQREQLAVLDSLGAALNPDLVVLMFFWNDLEDNTKNDYPAFAVDEHGLVVRTDSAAQLDFDPLALRDAKPVRDVWSWKRSYVRKLIKEGTRGYRRRLFGAAPRRIRTEAQLADAWRTTETLLSLVRLRSHEIGSDLLIVSIPDYNRVAPEHRIEGIEELNIHTEETLLLVCRRLRIACVDLFAPLRAHQEVAEQPLYYLVDRHLTPAGNAVVAASLIEPVSRILRSRP